MIGKKVKSLKKRGKERRFIFDSLFTNNYIIPDTFTKASLVTLGGLYNDDSYYTSSIECHHIIMYHYNTLTFR